ncbi:4-hydroxythreonine-4-phosphate dehydrogenase [Salibacterium salarium]|uniref:4-hydroxythreonine-4-phosphate dehydrogenase n=1 Tax=Salibacterium salarium TaxID=284579 RepID=A0A428N6D9_9BACI|nr:4-hydroxythreonine-4-phosphate dehydrogenase PdxA [Salibacterium salarium]RSL34034.1 4-hydroxythreonine-4-phosphate dehydrogenase [Salibacterium salarium]
MRMQNKSIMGLLLGEAAGIGPEITVKALQNDEIRNDATWVIIGDERVWKKAQKTAEVSLSYKIISSPAEANSNETSVWFIDLQNIDPSSIYPGEISEQSGRETGKTFKYAVEWANQNELDGIVYAPLNKEALHKGGFHFQDEIHFFADLFNCKHGFGEVNKLDNLWVTRVTSHIPLRKVGECVTKESVTKAICFAHNIVTQANIDPKIVVAGLNPHVGDGGLMGREEIDEILPAIQELRASGFDVDGPFPADTIYLKIEEENYNSLVSMYHDQAQIGMKLLGFHRGVTISGGLPVVLTTPAHGTAFDIVDKGTANSGAMIQAMKTAVQW